MPKFDVEFYIRHYNGSITIDAPTEREAQLIVERLDANKLEKHTSSFEVFVEDVRSV
jgi:hypothetical protein